MEFVWLIFILNNELLAIFLLSEARNIRAANPALSMGLRKQAYKLIGLSQD